MIYAVLIGRLADGVGSVLGGCGGVEGVSKGPPADALGAYPKTSSRAGARAGSEVSG